MCTCKSISSDIVTRDNTVYVDCSCFASDGIGSVYTS